MGDLEAFFCPTAVTFACFLMSQCAADLRVKELLTVPPWWSAHIPLLPLTQWECKSEVLPSHLHLWNLLEAHGETKIHRCRSRMRRWRTASRTRARRLLARSLATLETYFSRVVWLCRVFSKWLLLLKKTPVVVFRANLHLEQLLRFCANISPVRCLHQVFHWLGSCTADSSLGVFPSDATLCSSHLPPSINLIRHVVMTWSWPQQRCNNPPLGDQTWTARSCDHQRPCACPTAILGSCFIYTFYMRGQRPIILIRM